MSDGTEKSEPTRDEQLSYQASTVPGSPLPHVWVGDNTHKYSTLDLAASTQFTLFTGIAGHAWAQAAENAATLLGISLMAIVIGLGQTVTDLYDDWARVREVEEDGAILVRPDRIVAWRSRVMVSQPEETLAEVLRQLLSRED